jgi:hypothetical protein
VTGAEPVNLVHPCATNINRQENTQSRSMQHANERCGCRGHSGCSRSFGKLPLWSIGRTSRIPKPYKPTRKSAREPLTTWDQQKQPDRTLLTAGVDHGGQHSPSVNSKLLPLYPVTPLVSESKTVRGVRRSEATSKTLTPFEHKCDVAIRFWFPGFQPTHRISFVLFDSNSCRWRTRHPAWWNQQHVQRRHAHQI